MAEGFFDKVKETIKKVTDSVSNAQSTNPYNQLTHDKYTSNLQAVGNTIKNVASDVSKAQSTNPYNQLTHDKYKQNLQPVFNATASAARSVSDTSKNLYENSRVGQAIEDVKNEYKKNEVDKLRNTNKEENILGFGTSIENREQAEKEIINNIGGVFKDGMKISDEEFASVNNSYQVMSELSARLNQLTLDYREGRIGGDEYTSKYNVLYSNYQDLENSVKGYEVKTGWDYYDAIKDSGTDEANQLTSILSHYNDNIFERTVNGFLATAYDYLNTPTEFMAVAYDSLYGDLENNEFNKLALEQDEISAQLRQYSLAGAEPMERMTTEVLTSLMPQLIATGIATAAALATGPTGITAAAVAGAAAEGSTRIMGVQQGVSEAFQMINEGYTSEEAITHGIIVGSIGYLVEKIGAEDFTNAFLGTVKGEYMLGRELFARSINYKTVAKTIVRGSIDEMIEELMEAVVTDNANIIYNNIFETNMQTYTEPAELGKQMLYAGLGAMLMGTWKAGEVRIQTATEYKAAKQVIANLENLIESNQTQEELNDFEKLYNDYTRAVEGIEASSEFKDKIKDLRETLPDITFEDALNSVAEGDRYSIQKATMRAMGMKNAFDSVQGALDSRRIKISSNTNSEVTSADIFLNSDEDARRKILDVARIAEGSKSDIRIGSVATDAELASMYAQGKKSSGYFNKSTGEEVINIDHPKAVERVIAHEITHSLEQYPELYKKIKDLVDAEYKLDTNQENSYNEIGADLESERIAKYIDSHLADAQFLADVFEYDSNGLYRLTENLFNLMSTNNDVKLRNAFMDAYHKHDAKARLKTFNEVKVDGNSHDIEPLVPAANASEFFDKNEESIKNMISSGYMDTYGKAELNGLNRMNTIYSLYRKTALANINENVSQMDAIDAETLLTNPDVVTDYAWNGWINKSNSNYKADIVEDILTKPDVYNATMSLFYEAYKNVCAKNNVEALDFNTFLDTPIELYRATSGNRIEADTFASYTPDYDFAMKFANPESGMRYDDATGEVEKLTITPRETYGVINLEESEVAVPEFTKGVQFDITDVDNEGKELTDGQKSFFWYSKLVDEQGNLLKLYHTSNNLFEEFDPTGTPYYRFGHDTVMYFSDKGDVSGSYADYGNVLEDIKGSLDYEIANEKVDLVNRRAELENEIKPLNKTIQDYSDNFAQKWKQIDGYLYFALETYGDNEFESPLLKIKDFYEDNVGYLKNLDRYSKHIFEENDASESKEILTSLIQKSIDSFRFFEGTFFTKGELNALERRMQNFVDAAESKHSLFGEWKEVIDKMRSNNWSPSSYRYSGYGNAKNPFYVNGKHITYEGKEMYANWNYVTEFTWHKSLNNISNDFGSFLYGIKDVKQFEEITETKKNISQTFLEYLYKNNRSGLDFMLEHPDLLSSLANIMKDGKDYWTDETARTLVGEKNGLDEKTFQLFFETFEESEYTDIGFGHRYNIMNETNDIVKAVLAINEFLENHDDIVKDPYDGVIFDQITDSGRSNVNDPSRIVALFNSNQFKLEDNDNPTTLPNIQFDIEDEDGDYGYNYGVKDTNWDYIFDALKDPSRKSEVIKYGLHGTGHIGTGTYFFGYKTDGYRGDKSNSVEHAVDFSMNQPLYKPFNSLEASYLDNFLEDVNRMAFINSYDFDQRENIRKEIESYIYNHQEFVDQEATDKAYQEFLKENPEPEKKFLEGIDDDRFFELLLLGRKELIYTPEYLEYKAKEDAFDRMLNETYELADTSQDVNELFEKYFGKNPDFDSETSRKDMLDKLDNAISKSQTAYRFEESLREFGAAPFTNSKEELWKAYEYAKKKAETEEIDSPSTSFMKALGYNGVDNRGIKGYDNGSVGSVIYDVNPNSILYDIDEDESELSDYIFDKAVTSANEKERLKRLREAEKSVVEESINEDLDEDYEEGIEDEEATVDGGGGDNDNFDEEELEDTEKKHKAKILDEAKIEKKTLKEKIKDIVDNYIDKGSVFREIEKKTKVNVNELYDNTLMASNMADYAILEGIVKYEKGADDKYKARNGESFLKVQRDIEKLGAGRRRMFFEYLYELRNMDSMSLEERGFGENKEVTGNSVEESREIVERLEADNPEFKKLADRVYSICEDALQIYKDAGIINEDTYNLFKNKYPHYVPIMRTYEEEKSVKGLDANKGIKRAKGGTGNIQSFYKAMMGYIRNAYKTTTANELYSTLANVKHNEVQKLADEGNFLVDDLAALGDDFEMSESEDLKGANKLIYYENGKKKFIKVSDRVINALTTTKTDDENKALVKINSFRRKLLTSWNPVFTVKNFLRDYQDAVVNTKYNLTTYNKNYAKAFAEMTSYLFTSTKEDYKMSDTLRLFFAMGGGNLKTKVNEQNFVIENDADSFGAKMLEGLEKFSDSVEMIPRYAEFLSSLEAGNSAEKAIFDSQEVTVNFKRGGDRTKMIDRNLAPFLSASVNGAMKQFHNWEDAANKDTNMKSIVGIGSYMMRLTLTTGIPLVLVNGFMWRKDKDYENLSDYVKDNYYIVWKNSDGTFLRIPKGRAAAFYQTFGENVLDYIANEKEFNDAASEIMTSFFDNIAPNNPLENNTFSPILSVLFNKTWYGTDLVPSRLEGRQPADQWDESTSSLAKAIGKATNISPMKVNYLLDQYSGVLGDIFLPYMTPKANHGGLGTLLAPLADAFTVDPVMKNQATTDFFELKEKLNNDAGIEGSSWEVQLSSKYINSRYKEITDLYAKRREINNSDLPRDEKYKQVREVQRKINTLMADVLNKYDQIDIGEASAIVGDIPYRLQEDGTWDRTNEKSNAYDFYSLMKAKGNGGANALDKAYEIAGYQSLKYKGKTYTNSKALQIRHGLIEAGIYDDVVASINSGETKTTNWGLNKTVMGYSETRFLAEYEKMMRLCDGSTDDESSSTSSSSKKKKKSTKTYYRRGGGSKKVKAVKAPTSTKTSVTSAKVETTTTKKKETKNKVPSYMNAYASVINRRKETSQSGAKSVCPRCGATIPATATRCPVCGKSV